MQELRGREIIFIVDDERLIAYTLAIVLRQHGFDAEGFLDGRSALSAASSCRPDILLTDVAMPLMDGFKLAAAMRTLHPSCAVLFLSGHASRSSLEKNECESPDWQFLSKPVHPRTLIPVLRALCRP